MAKAKTKEVAAVTVEGLTVQERVDLYAKGVKDLSDRLQIGMHIPPPELKFVDLIQLAAEQKKAQDAGKK